MAKKQKNFAAFYVLAGKMPGVIDNKEEFVLGYTNGRTSSLREMSPAEYNAMITDMKCNDEGDAERRRARSSALHAMQKIGVDTTSWDKVDEFCMNNRIAGKVFRMLTAKDLIAVRKKCEAIRLKDRKKDKELDEVLERVYRFTDKKKCN